MYYFIDFENVGESGLEGVKNLTSEDKVFVFYGQNAKTIPFERMIEIISSGAGLEFIKSNKIAKNYVDFQLTSYAGYFIGMGYRGTVVIVSKDTGFDSAVDFWKARNIQVVRRDQIAAQPKQNNGRKKQQRNTNNGNQRKRQNNRNRGENVQQTETENVPAAEIKETAAVAEIPAAPEEPAEEAPVSETAAEEIAASAAETEVPAPETETAAAETESSVGQTAEISGQSENTEERKRNKPAEQKKPAVPESIRKKIRAAVKEENLSSTRYTAIYRIFDKAQTAEQLKNMLEKSFGGEKGGKLTELLTAVFTGYKGE